MILTMEASQIAPAAWSLHRSLAWDSDWRIGMVVIPVPQPSAISGLLGAVVEPLEDGGVRRAWSVDAGQRAHGHPDDEQHDRSGARPSRVLKNS